jgi:hypothetical protein
MRSWYNSNETHQIRRRMTLKESESLRFLSILSALKPLKTSNNREATQPDLLPVRSKPTQHLDYSFLLH